MNNDNAVCEVCGGENAQIKHITRSYGRGESLLVIENVPVITCSTCGESYLQAVTLHEIAEIKKNRSSFAKKRFVEVAELA